MSHHPRFRRLPRVAVLAGLMALAGLAVPAHAQQIDIQVGGFSPMMGETSFSPMMSRNQLEHYGRVLTLDEEQQLIADELLNAYRDDFGTAAAEVRRKLADIREEAQATGDFMVYSREYGPAMTAWAKQREVLDESFENSLRSLLREPQEAYWDLYKRERRRAQLLPDARLGGEDVDVIDLLNNLGLEESTRAGLDEILEQYAVEIDAALQSRDRVLEPLQQEYREALGDPEAAAEIWEEATRKRTGVRNLNRRFVEQIAGALPEAEAADLRLAYETLAYPVAFEPTKAHRMIEATRELASISADQRSTVDSLETDLEARLQSVRSRLISLIKEQEKEPPAMLTQLIRSSEGGARQMVFTSIGDEDDPMRDLLKQRFDLSKATIEQIEGVMSPDQLESLPDLGVQQNFSRRMRGLRFRL